MAVNRYTEEVISRFLFNTATPPTNLVDKALIRPNNVKGNSVNIDASWYMSEGAGRFAKASMSPIVQKFFEQDANGNYVNALAVGTYSKSQALTALPTDTIQFDFQQYEYDDGEDNFGERVFIYNSTGFSLGQNIEFVVNANGTREIKNMSVQSLHEVDSRYPEDNFDFESDNPVAFLNNSAARKIIDPSKIGRTVEFEFTGSWSVQSSYTLLDYISDVQDEQDNRSSFYNSSLPLGLESHITPVLEDLVSENGPAHFIDDQGRPVLYGQYDGGTIALPSQNDFYPKLKDHFENGVVMVGADHTDYFIYSDEGNSEFYGGGGDDVITAGQGNDTLFGEDGKDILVGNDGDDNLFGGKEDDIFRAGRGSDLIDGGEVGLAITSDGLDTADYSSLDKSIEITAFGVSPVDREQSPIYVRKDLLENDSLYSIEIIKGTDYVDYLVVNELPEDVKLKIQNLGGTANDEVTDLIDASALSGVDLILDDYGNGTLKQKNGSGGRIEFENISVQSDDAKKSRIKLTDSDDQIQGNFGTVEIDTGSGNDSISITGFNSIIHTGAGNDLIGQLGVGTELTTGTGEDTIDYSNGVLITDADGYDRINYGGREIGSAVKWGGAESIWATTFGGRIRIGFNDDGEMVINSALHNAPSGFNDDAENMYLANGNNDSFAASANLTAGIRTSEIEIEAFQIRHVPEGRSLSENDALWEFMGLLWKDFFSDVRVAGSDPLVLDLDGDGLELTAVSSVSTMFDVDGDQFAEHTGWIGRDDGFLAIDLDGNGQIDDVSELFGNATTSGFTELSSYDSNSDGIIDENDTQFVDLRIWQDLNSDGVTDEGELKALSEHDITSIDLTATEDGSQNALNLVARTGNFTRGDGTTGTVGDIEFRIDNFNTEFTGDKTVDPTIAATMPNLKGHGTLTDLHVALTLDQTGQLAAVINNTLPTLTDINMESLREKAFVILNSWANISPGPSVPNNPDVPILIEDTSSGRSVIDFAIQVTETIINDDDTTEEITFWKLASRKDVRDINDTIIEYPTYQEVLAQIESNSDRSWDVLTGENLNFLERYIGEDIPVEDIRAANSSAISALSTLLDEGASIINSLALRLAAQGPLQNYFDGVEYNIDEDTFVPTTDRQLTHMFEAILSDAPADSAGAQSWISSWEPLIDVLLADYDRGASHLKNSFSFLFSNLVAAYENVGPNISIVGAANAFGIPSELIKTGTGELIGSSENDIFYMNAGNQIAKGGTGHDVYVFGRDFGQDIIDDIENGNQAQTPDVIRFADYLSSDITAKREGLDLILSVEGTTNEVRVLEQFIGKKPGLFGGNLEADRGVKEIIFADGEVWDAIDIAKAASHRDDSSFDVIGTDSIDFLDGGAGDDRLEGGGDGDIYYFGIGYGHDTIFDELTNVLVNYDDYLFFEEGLSFSDLTFTRDGNSNDLEISINGTTDKLTIENQFWTSNTGPFGIVSFNQIETFWFGTRYYTNEQIIQEILKNIQTDGDDIIYGFYRQDTLDGKAGDDFLSGGDDSDTYYFGKGYGQDVIEDDQKIILTASGDTVIFNGDVAVNDVIFSRDGNSDDLLISFADDSATLKITDQFNLAYTGLGKYWFDRIETFQFQDANSTTVSWDELFADLIEQDQTNGNDTIYGFDWEDVLDGGQGDDFLTGGNENDTYIFGAGYGHDTIDDDYETRVGNGEFDVVSFKSDLNATDATITRDDDHIEIVFATGERLTVLNQFNYGGLSATSYDEIEEYQFSDGTVWTIDDIRAQLLQGTDGDDVITGFGLEDVLDGGAGNDRLIGLDASDTYVFDVGYGQDVILDEVRIVSYSNQDVIEFGAGISTSNIELSKDGDDLVFSIVGATDTLTVENFFYGSFGYYEIEEFNFHDGTSWSLFDVKQFILADSITDGDDIILGYSGIDHIDGGLGNDHISTLAGDDTLIGGFGDDTLIGGNGSDTYIFGAGYGHDTIDDDYHDIFSSKTDLVSFNSDLDASDATLTRNNDHLEILFSSGEQLTILNQFSYGGLSSISYDEIEEYQFSDGTVWTSEGIRLQLLQGTDGDDVITGYGLNDILDGGAGNDRLLGLDGSDTYKFDLGYGQDVIYDRLGIVSYTSHDVVEFGPGITTANLLFNRDGDDLVFSIQGTSDTLTIENVFEGSFGYYEVEEFRFNDGTSWSLSEVKQSLLDSSMTDGDDYVLGFGDGDLLNGGLGDDTIIGLAGDDLITGSLGDDVLEGGKGSDTYVYNVGDGNDTIFDSQSASYETDRVILHGINADEVLVSRSSNDSDDYILTFLNGSTVTLDEQYWGTYGSGIEEVVFDDGTVWSKADLELQLLANSQTDGDDVISDFRGDDVIEGGLGDDIISGSSGADTYIYTAGDGNDLISDTTSSSSQIDKLVLHNIESNDVTLSRSLSDLDDLILTLSDNSTIELNEYFWGYGQSIEQIIFDDGTVWTKADVEAALLTEEPEDDAIHGTDGNDTLNGTSDNETFDGGLGDDTLSGKQGDDSYRYSSGDGDDTIKELSYHSGSDSLVFKDLNESDVTISRSWSDAEVILITDNATGHSITLDEQLYNTKSGVEEIVYADGSVQSADTTTLRDLAQYQGTTSDDIISGGSSRDVFDGGLGKDTLSGKQGDDSYHYGSGDGNDIIKELYYHSGTDQLVFKDLNLNDLTFSIDPTVDDDLFITVNSTGDVIELDEQLYSENAGIEEIIFADGTTFIASLANVNDLISA